MIEHCAFRVVQLAATIATMMTVACSKGGDAAGDAAGESTPTVPARVAVVATQPFTETLGAIGTVTPRVGHVASLSAPAAARVARVLVSVGQHVQVGQVLVDL